jgi:hypothetical protein
MVKLRSMTKTRQISANQRQAEINHRLHAELPEVMAPLCLSEAVSPYG